LPDDAKSDIAEVAKKAIAAIGIDDGPAHTEIILTKEGPKVVELGARLGGDYITTSLVPLATGIDMVQACIDLAIGNNPDINPKFDRGSAIRYLDSYDGILCGIKGVEKARNIEGMHEIKILKSVGDELKEITNSADRVGYVIAHADSTQKAIDVCDQALAQVNIMIGKG
jgi:biotin carboxylase